MASDMHRLSADLGPVRPLTDAETEAVRELIADRPDAVELADMLGVAK